jgi:hypothetical protein
MTKEQIIHSYGKPNEVYIAGQSRFENERWHYFESLKSIAHRVIYFEGGRVVGWE